MFSIYKKEISQFFASLTGYIVIGVFLVLAGIVMWAMPNQSVIDFGFATLDPLFSNAPLFFLFLIPAVTMRSFAEEKASGTLEILATKPISDQSVVFGKFLASLTLVGFSLLLTAVYFFSVSALGSPKGNLDSGGIFGSYIGLFFLAGVFISIGLFASSLTSNQIVAFVLGVLFCLFMHWGWETVSFLPKFLGHSDDLIQTFGIQLHYNSISRGLLDARDLIYFLSIIALFLTATVVSLGRRNW
jgi:ABC-2 type transport system permease protein